MTPEQTNMESAQPQGTELPNSASQGSGQPSSAEAAGTVSLQELTKRLETVERANQSAKDRAIDQLRKEFETKLSEVSGKPVIKEETPEAVVQSNTGTISGAQAIPEALARFTEVGLSVSDPDVASLIQKSTSYQDRRDFLLEVERTINRKSIKPPVSTGAVIPSASAPPPPPGMAELTREYQNKMIAARGQKSLAQAIKAEYAERGVPVDKVGFTIS